MADEHLLLPMRGPYFPDQTDWNDAAIREHLCRLAQVAEATASAVIITDLRGVIVWVNEGFTRISGYDYARSSSTDSGLKWLNFPRSESEEFNCED